MKLLITGSSGYIGSRVLQALPHDVEVMAVRHKDGINKDAIRAFVPDVVLHMATLSTSRWDSEIIDPMLDANIRYGVHLLDAIAGCDTKPYLINIGSFAEYRLGTDNGQKDAYLYTATKSAFRHFVDYYADACGFDYCTLVPYTVYGGQDTAKKLMDYMVESATSEQAVDMTPGEQVLDFIHVDDVVRAIITIITGDKPKRGEELHLGTGRGTRVRDLATMIEQIIGKRLNIRWGGREYRPLDVMRAVAPKSEWLSQRWQATIRLEDGIKQQFA